MATQKIDSSQKNTDEIINESGTMASAALTPTYQTVASYTVPASKVAQTVNIYATFEFNAATNSAEMTGRITKNGVMIGQNYWFASGVVYFNTIPVITQTTVVPGDIIDFQTQRTSGTGNSLVARSKYIIAGS